MLLIDKTLLRLAKGLWGWIFAILAVRLLALAAITHFSATISSLIGDLVHASASSEQIRGAILTSLGIAALILAFDLAKGELEYRCTASARVLLRRQIFAKVTELDAGRIERLGPVSAITTSVDAVESIQIYYSQYLPGLLYSISAPFYLFFRLQRVNLTVALILGIAGLLLLPLNNAFRSRIEETRKSYWGSMEDMTAYYLENLRGIQTIKLFGQEETRTRVLAEKSYAFKEWILEFMSINFTSFLATEGVINLALVLGTLACASLLAKGALSISSALLLLMLGFTFFNSFRELLQTTHYAITAVAAADKVEEVLDIDTSRPYDTAAPRDPREFEGLRMEDVSLAYEGRGFALKGVSMEIPKGKVTAIAGLSGCGKSTSAAVFMKFLDPAEGRVYIEGSDYVSLTPRQLRSRVILVPQSVYIFSGTLRDNLLAAAPDASDEELMQALEEVSLADWVRSLPDGLSSDTGDAGSKLSGGQRQKIGIARALLKKAEYIIFDEATSSVDPKSEQDIWSCIRKLALTRTLIIISHRLSTIRWADRIYVMEAGEVTACGTHEELMEKSGLYRSLVCQQQALEGGMSHE